MSEEFPTGMIPARPEDEALLEAEVKRRIEACRRVCRGIPTSDLEEGRVVVVRVEDLRKVHQQLVVTQDLLRRATGKGVAPTADRWLEEARVIVAPLLKDALSRIQQTGQQVKDGEPHA